MYNAHVHVISELTEFKTRRIAYFKKNLVDLVELELKHAKVRFNWKIFIIECRIIHEIFGSL